MSDKTIPTDGLAVDIARAGDALEWHVANRGREPVWAFLLVPTIVEGRWSFATDAGWLADDDGTLVVRKVDTPVPDDIDADRVRSGAIRLDPGDERRGTLALGAKVSTRAPYRDRPHRVDVRRVVLEIGWVPVRDGQQVERLDWQGQPFGYLFPEDEPGGQRFARSAVLTW